MASGASNHESTLSSAPAPPNPTVPMNLSNMDLAQLQANGLQSLPGLDPNQLMNLLRHLPNVFTKVRRFAHFPSSEHSTCLSNLPSTPCTPVAPSPISPILNFAPSPPLHVIVLRSSRLRVLHAASHDILRCIFFLTLFVANRRWDAQGGRRADALEPLPVLPGRHGPGRVPRERPGAVVAPARAPEPRRPPPTPERQHARHGWDAQPAAAAPRAGRGRRRRRRVR
ncbi:hypothetical protein B0H11DRAFT_255927 [Mycena galericulata]|nr:hypothetical protein B0H11DRAFT_255927 [Mycena galericulata]